MSCQISLKKKKKIGEMPFEKDSTRTRLKKTTKEDELNTDQGLNHTFEFGSLLIP